MIIRAMSIGHDDLSQMQSQIIRELWQWIGSKPDTSWRESQMLHTESKKVTPFELLPGILDISAKSRCVQAARFVQNLKYSQVLVVFSAS